MMMMMMMNNHLYPVLSHATNYVFELTGGDCVIKSLQTF